MKKKFCENPKCKHHVDVDVDQSCLAMISGGERQVIQEVQYLTKNGTMMNVCSSCNEAYEFVKNSIKKS